MASALQWLVAAGLVLGLLPPVGVSFYTFQSVGYIIDVYRGLLEAERNFGRLALFVVTVDPWSLSLTGPEGVFPEDNSFIGQMPQVSQNPNFAYLTRYQTKPLYRLLLDYATATERLHPDGWLEVRIGTDSVQVRARTQRKLLDYR